MALRLTIADRIGQFADFDDFEVVLHKLRGGEGSITIAGYDVEAEQAARALGFEVDTPQLWVYELYTREGLRPFSQYLLDDVYEALEEQGYDVFEDGNFDKKTFFKWLLDDLEENSSDVELIIEFLEGNVEEARSALVPKSLYVDALIEGLKKDASPDAHWSEGQNIRTYLEALKKQLPDDEFKFYQQDPYTDEPEYGEMTVDISYSIDIAGEEIVEWGRSFMLSIYDPIWFEHNVIDYCAEGGDPESCPPESADTIMSYFGWEYDDRPLHNIDGPEHPEEDYDGNFGVEYVQFYTRYVKKESGGFEPIREGITKSELVTYGSFAEAMEAAELSEALMDRDGSRDEWDITIVEKTVVDGEEEWLPVEEEE